MESNDPTSPRLRLTVSANIVVELGFEHQQARFDKVRQGKPSVQRVSVIGALAPEVTLTEVITDVPGLTAKLVPGKAGPNRAAQDLELTLTPDTIGEVRGAVRVKTSHTRFPELSLRVMGKVIGDLEVQPDRLVISPTDAKDKAYTLLAGSERGGLKGLDVVDANGFMDAKVIELETGKSWRVEITRAKKGRAAEDAFSTTLKVSAKGDPKSAAEIKVYFRGAGASRRAFSKGAGLKAVQGKKAAMTGAAAALRAKRTGTPIKAPAPVK